MEQSNFRYRHLSLEKCRKIIFSIQYHDFLVCKYSKDLLSLQMNDKQQNIKDMQHKFTPEQICEIGQRLAALGLVKEFAPHSHSHNVSILYPQTLAQYRWLKSNYGTIYNCVILFPKDKIAELIPELSDFLVSTKSKQFTRIDLSL